MGLMDRMVHMHPESSTSRLPALGREDSREP